MSWRACLISIALASVAAPGASTAAEPTATPPAAASARPDGVEALLGAFRGMTGFEARFEEAKHMALLAAPLKTRGRIYFAPPGYLARHVEAPQPSQVVITPDSLHMTDATGTQRIDLRARPDVKTFVESFMRVLAGDRAGLEQVYTLTLAPDPDAGADDAWVLTLTPRGEPLSQLIRDLTIRGRGVEVSTITIAEKSGDRSVITILEANPKRTFDAEERARLFGPPAK